MQAAIQTSRPWSITGKFNDAEKERVFARAADLGMKPAEWVRRVILLALDAGADTMFLAGEVAALRGILYGVASQLGGVTPEILASLQKRADAGKDAAAKARWQAYSAKAQKEVASDQ
jgi:hypothetical protein